MPTTNAVPSDDPSDLLFNAQKLDEVINGTAESFIDRRGVQRLTLTGALRLIGFEAPVAFASGLTITRSTQTVTNGGNTYHADPASLPFTTTSTFNGAQWRLASNVTTFDLAAYAVPLVGGAGTIEMAKLTTAVQNLINGALQRSGGTMTGALTLPGNAVNALDAMPLQQATGRLLAVRVFTTANNGQTYTPTAGTTSVVVEAVGGGGAGGGGVTTTSGNVSLGSGGSGGAFGMARLTSGFSGVTLTIAAGGTAAIGGNGGAGGTTSFGALLSCPGGVGGGVGGIVANTVASYSAATALAAAPSGANIQSHRGYPCERAYLLGGGSQSGGGGSTLLGSGGPALTVPNTGAAGDGYGAGGGGGATSGSAASSGGNGAPGVIIVWEFA